MGLLAVDEGTSGAAKGLRWLAFLVLMVIVGFFLAAAASAHDAECHVEVSPRAGAGGSAFHFAGHGFTPATVTLEGGSLSTTHDLNLGDDDPWSFTIRSRTADAGRWTATFATPDGCQASASFRVTLANTDSPAQVIDEGSGRVSGNAWALVVAAGMVAGLLVGRRVRFAIGP